MLKKNPITEISYWESFYSDNELIIPSQFCALFMSEVDSSIPVVEFGCGSGRDAFFLARHRYYIHAMDLSEQAIAKNIAKASKLDNALFRQGDVSKGSDVSKLIAGARDISNQNIAIYSRFFIHSLDAEQERSFMSTISRKTIKGDLLYFEFRSMEDRYLEKSFGNHFRRYVNTERFLECLENEYGFDIIYSITGQGMAKYKAEDPFVTRIIAHRK